MVFKNSIVIAALSLIGLGLLAYWMSLPSVPDGVTPQSGEDQAWQGMAALAGAITTLGTAVFGVLGKLNEYKEKRLSIQMAELEIEEKRRQLDAK